MLLMKAMMMSSATTPPTMAAIVGGGGEDTTHKSFIHSFIHSFSRVILLPVDDEEGSDYINACWIPVSSII